MRRHAKASSAGSNSGRGKGSTPIGGALVCVLALLAFAGSGAPSAGAAVPAKGVTGFFGSAGVYGGQLKTPRGMAVNQATGNVYVADSENHRVSVFDPNGKFLRAWGRNAIAHGPDNLGTEAFEICIAANGDVCNGATGPAIPTGNTGGNFRAPQGIAVNQTTGDVYVADQGNSRIQQFDSNGAFIRAFGFNVVAKGPDNVGAAEVQSVTVKASSGTFRLSFEGVTTQPIPYNAPPATVQTELNALVTIGGAGGSVVVSGGPGSPSGTNPYLITFGDALLGDVAQVAIKTENLGQPTGTLLTCSSTTAADNTAFQWLRNGTPIGGATAAEYTTTAGDAGAAIQCRVTKTNNPSANNTSGTGTVQASSLFLASPAPVTTAPAPPPAQIAAPTLVGSLTVGSTPSGVKLTCAPGIWDGEPSFAYQWYRNGVALAGNGANTTEYTVQTADLASRAVFQCAVTGTNPGGSVVKFSSVKATTPSPEPSAPGGEGGVPGVSVNFGIPTGTPLACASTTAADNTAFQWLRNGTPIGGATSATYSTEAADAGAAIQCRVTKTNNPSENNAQGTGTIQASTSIVASPAPVTTAPVPPGQIAVPTLVGSLTVPSTPVGVKLTCVPGSWSGTPTFAYQWYRNGVALAGNGANTAEYTVQEADLAARAVFQCAVIATNAGGSVVRFSQSRSTEPPPSPTAPGGEGGLPVATVTFPINSTATPTPGGAGFEICSASNGDVCRGGEAVTSGGGFGTALGQLAIAPAGAPNAGDVLVADTSNLRVQEFSGAGAFIRAFGFDVTTGGATTFEVCAVAANCKIGVSGANSGQFATGSPTQVAEDSAGNVYTLEPVTNFRVQKFTLPANVVTPAGTFDGADLTGAAAASAPAALAINPSTNNLLVAKGFAAGATASCPITATASPVERRVLEVSAAGALEGTHGLCAGITPINGVAIRGSSGNLYASSTFGNQRVYVLNTGQPLAPTAAITNVSGIGAHGATINGLIGPNGPELPYGLQTTYTLEYKRSADAGFTKVSNSEASAGNRTTTKAVALGLNGLQANTEYDVKLVANKGFGSGSASHTVAFTTLSAPPEVSLPDFISTSATKARLSGAVLPNNLATGYHFDYVDEAGFEEGGFSGATQVPLGGAGAGSGATATSVSQEISGLSAGTTYHYRLVASNSSGQADATGSFTTPAGPAGCPNAAIRAGQTSPEYPQGSTVLPECMALEMVSPPKKFNQLANRGEPSPTGDAIRFTSLAALEDAEFLASYFNNPYTSTRGASGWTAHALVPSPDLASGVVTPCAYSTDLSQWSSFLARDSQAEIGAGTAYLSNFGGIVGALSPTVFPVNSFKSSFGASGYECLGGSADASHLFIGVQEKAYFPGDSVVPSLNAARLTNVYESYLDEDGTPTMRLLQRDKDGKVWGGNCGSEVVGRLGAISADASVVYFGNRPDEVEGTPCNANTSLLSKRRVMRRVQTLAGPQVSIVSAGECTRVAPPCDVGDGDDTLMGASREADKAIFTSTRQLANSDLDTGTQCSTTVGNTAGCDLYLYDSTASAGARLTQISAGDATDATPGKGANVLGVGAFAGDLSHVYLVAEGVLTTTPNALGRSAEAGKPNLYIYERDAAHPGGRTAFIATLGSSDSGAWGAGGSIAVPRFGSDIEDTSLGGDGHLLFFQSTVSLTPDDTDGGSRDIYRYDSNDGALERITVAAPGGSDNGAFPSSEVTGRISEDGRTVAFSTQEALDPADTDSQYDAYLWHDGQVAQIPGAVDVTPENGFSGIKLSASGNEVVFTSDLQLLPQDGDNTKDVYVARAGGGYAPPPPVVPCEGEACQGSPAAQPDAQGAASEAAVGAGNVKEAVKKTHKKKHRKKHHKKRRHRHSKRAGHEHGGQK